MRQRQAERGRYKVTICVFLRTPVSRYTNHHQLRKMNMVTLKQIPITVELNKFDAKHLARFLRSANFHDYRACARSDDDAYRMIDASAKVRAALFKAGFNGD